MRRVFLTTATTAVLSLSVAGPAAAEGIVCTTHFEQVPAAPAAAVWYVEVEECVVVAPSPPPSPATVRPPAAPVRPAKVKPGKTSSSTQGTGVPGTVRHPKGSGTSVTGSRTGTDRRTTQISGRHVSTGTSAPASRPGFLSSKSSSSSKTSATKNPSTTPEPVKPSASATAALVQEEKAVKKEEKTLSTDSTKLAKTGAEDVARMLLASSFMFLGAGVLLFVRRRKLTSG